MQPQRQRDITPEFGRVEKLQEIMNAIDNSDTPSSQKWFYIGRSISKSNPVKP